MTDYQPYDIASIQESLAAMLEKAQQAHQAACDAHRRSHMRVYEAYPFKDSDGAPEWHTLSRQEQSVLLRVKWPALIQFLIPSLKDKIVASGAEIAMDTSPPPNQNLLQKTKNKIARNFKSFMWRYGSKDHSRLNESIRNQRQAYKAANKAWEKIQYHKPKPSYSAYVYENISSQLAEESARQKAKGRNNPTLWLKEAEARSLTEAMQEQNLDEAVDTLYMPVLSNRSIETMVEILESFRASEEWTCTFDRFENVENSALLDKIKNTLGKSPLGASLLDLAEKDGLSFHLQQHKSDAIRNEQTPGAYIKGKDVYLIDVEEHNIGTQAVYLGHELRHHWQAATFAEFYKANDTPIDRILRTHYKELDAWAVTILLAHNLHQQGVELSDGLTESVKEFEYICEAVREKSPQTRGLPKKTAMSCFFQHYINPNFLGAHESKHINDFMRLSGQDLKTLIGESPYNKEDFITRITELGGDSYLVLTSIPTIIETLHQGVGLSEHAQKGLNWSQPQHRIEAFPPQNNNPTTRQNPALALTS